MVTTLEKRDLVTPAVSVSKETRSLPYTRKISAHTLHDAAATQSNDPEEMALSRRRGNYQTSHPGHERFVAKKNHNL